MAETIFGCGHKATYAHTALAFLERGARSHPERVAVVDERGERTYGELYERSRRVASGLLERGLGGGPLIVCMEKNAEALEAFFGALMAGGFYVPVDPGAPSGRAARCLERLGRPPVVCDEGGLEAARALFPDALALTPGELGRSAPDDGALERAARDIVPSDVAYVLFTSGSTGEPKGVAVSHAAVLEFVSTFVGTFGLRPDDVVGNQAPLDFDVSVKDVYGALAAGARVVLLPRRLFSAPARLVAELEERRVTVLVWAAAALCLVSGLRALDGAALSLVRLVMFSGEVMPAEHLRRWMRRLPGATFVNLYGPTEVTCNCLYHVVDRGRDYRGGVPLGRPLPGRRVLLLDGRGRPVSEPGRVGEIYVGGTAIARGYYADPARTRDAFVQSPLVSELPETLYRTGDLALAGEDGELFFCGRRDNQVKIQGHRIELEEVDAAFERQEGVDRCRCALDERTGRICAFFEGSAGPDELRRAVALLVPGPAVPAVIERVESMPLLGNGKVDRAALLEDRRARRGRACERGGGRRDD
ncbi:amino acid adenylation domain-containing protein [Thermophilibacter mediterraneus]|uniref:amino acid adenylation domain-containing protein n=1 Tax=Thermophilibacter mediterraneus TaxID=1871031 RepID=UPI000931D957|nr:amino acid adenylation domain-containing protein [Thermophilibacter mediterraneus]